MDDTSHYVVRYFERSVTTPTALGYDEDKFRDDDDTDQTIAYRLGVLTQHEKGQLSLRVRLQVESDEARAAIDQSVTWFLKNLERTPTPSQAKNFFVQYGAARALPPAIAALTDLMRQVDASPAGPPSEVENQMTAMLKRKLVTRPHQ